MSTDDERRMHTAEHVLNQVMVRLLGTGRAFSTHINARKSKCDYRFLRPLSEEEARAVEMAVGEVLALGLPVTEAYLPRKVAEEQFDLFRLPETASDPLRIVRVGGYDACPCIGEHVANTSEIGTFRLTTHSYADGVLRLRFKLAALA